MPSSLDGSGCGRSPTLADVVSPAGLEKRIRAICLDLPGVTEKLSHGAPAFFVGRQFLMLWIDGHHETRVPSSVVCGTTGRPE